MSKEKFIRGKKDNCHHDGLYSNTKRLQEAEHKLKDFLENPSEVVLFDLKDQPQKPKPEVDIHISIYRNDMT